MRVCALLSGGKDSIFAIHLTQCAGHQVVALANLHPPTPTTDELPDSHMFQTIGHALVPVLAAECLQLPLFTAPLLNGSKRTQLHYEQTNDSNSNSSSSSNATATATKADADDEIEDLFALLSRVKHEMRIDAVCSGAILSNYQRLRVENVCSRLGLQSLAPLWQLNQSQLLQRMLTEAQLHAIVIKVAASGLSPRRDLGQTLASLQSRFEQLSSSQGVHVCGEGGEYESLVLDCSLYKRRLVIEESEIVSDYAHMTNDESMSGLLRIKRFTTEAKQDNSNNAAVTKSSTTTNDALQQLSQLRIAQPLPRNSTASLQEDGTEWRQPDLALLQHLRIASAAPAHFPAITRCAGGALAFLSTHSIENAASQALSLQDETFLLLSYCKQLLREQHCAAAHIHLYLQSMLDFAPVNHAYRTVFALNQPPSRSCVQFAAPHTAASNSSTIATAAAGKLPRLYVDMLAYDTRIDASTAQLQRQVLHVQSISSWSAACIGPYSQCNHLSGVLYLCGVIGLEPQSMQLPAGDLSLNEQIDAQLTQMTQNADAILNVVQSSPTQCLHITCYLDSKLRLSPDDANATHQRIAQHIEQHYNASHNAPVLYLYVPALPARALIELELIAYERRHASHYSTLQLHQPSVRSCQFNQTGRVTSLTKPQLPVCCNLFGSSVNDIASLCADLFIVAVRSEQHWRQSQLVLKCYHVPQLISQSSLAQALHSALQLQMQLHFVASAHAELEMPAVSFVAVDHLKGLSSAESAEHDEDKELVEHAFALHLMFAQLPVEASPYDDSSDEEETVAVSTAIFPKQTAEDELHEQFSDDQSPRHSSEESFSDEPQQFNAQLGDVSQSSSEADS